MATSIPGNDPTSNQDLEKPNHMIIWLNQHIGKRGECSHLKQAFAINIDPRHETWIMLNDHDYDRLRVTGDEMIVEFNGVKVLLHASDNEDACVEAFKRNQDKRIFFITSGSMGKTAVPRIIERYRNVFTDSTTNEAYSSVYSLISIRIIDLVESNNSNVHVFANSVFPTPVGPIEFN